MTGDEPQGTMGRVQTAGEATSRPLSPSRLPLRAHFHQKRDVWVRGRQRIVLKHFGGVPVLKFLQRLALDFPYLSVIFPGLAYRQMLSGSRSSSACNAHNFFQENP